MPSPFELLAEAPLPALGQRLDLQGAAEELLVVPEAHVELLYLLDCHPARVLLQMLDGIAGFDLALALHGQVEAAPTALQEPLHHRLVAELDPQFEARRARLRDDHLRLPD